MDNYDLTAVVCLSILGYVSKTHRQEGKTMGNDLVITTRTTTAFPFTKGKVIWGEHKAQVLYGQDLPCMFRWTVATEDGESLINYAWCPCPEC